MVLLNSEDDEVAHDQRLDLLYSMSYTDAVAAHHFVGTEIDMQHFVGSEDCTKVFVCMITKGLQPQGFADPSDNNEQHQQQQPPEKPSCKRQHQPIAAEAPVSALATVKAI